MVALVVLTVALTVVVGVLGTVAGLATAIAWYVLGTPYAVAAGHVVLATAFPNGIGLESFVLVELPFVVFVLAPTIWGTDPLRDGAVGLASAVGLVGIGWIVAQSQPLWLAAATVILVFALAAYTLHRYELVRLGLVPDDYAADSHDT
ncbi:hypothetical protein GS429_07015 [Natronorubrum sp. JWXQ-INN-674]|uniref:DUF8163 domain-containing protein n=1 Tax=Natronorubrum halalkaliphilum TaxID=2691917 RepID=A0A6B0VMN1_9EURY|nr:hypothetical protein [Natronorubrum halalkaliphilum]